MHPLEFSQNLKGQVVKAPEITGGNPCQALEALRAEGPMLSPSGAARRTAAGAGAASQV